jgi:uncharacterized circularly permuted ATP-grasp superfamily protein/signal transduction histidine kinase
VARFQSQPQVGERHALIVFRGPYDPAAGLRCSPSKLLLDPYAKAIDGGVRWDAANTLPYRPAAPDAEAVADASDDAQTLERGLIQRGRLLEALMHDLYGPQRCVEEGLLPRELVYGNPAFLRPCHKLSVAGDRYVHLYAANIGRAADGAFRVLGDRTQSPSGAGYALENRLVLSRMLPDAFRDCHVQRLAPFFLTLRDTLRAIAPHNRDNPRIVLLTPGPYNETYFEHAYLARYLGFTLVEGGDLTVRDRRVFIKTLEGLQPVDVIFRRLDDSFCDPLELRSDSALGIAGLLGALRAGRVMVANALGTGVLESAAWLGFLPPVAERLLGEKLSLPEVATWWLGEKPALEYVLANLDRLVIKPAYPNQRFEPMFGRDFTGAARDALIERLRNRPYAYVAQEHVRLSHAPVWKSAASTELAARALTIRVYAVMTPDGVRVMPGGLARVANESAADVVSTQRGGGAKDVWVLSEGNDEASGAPDSAGSPGKWSMQARHDYIPARLVENLYWLGRYTVRCENVARLTLRVLQGEPTGHIPVVTADLNVTQVDWRELRKWGVPESRVPAGTAILFREPSIWERYRSYLEAALAVFFAQTALIAGLLVQRARRRRAEAQVRRSEAELRASNDRLHDLGARLLSAQDEERSRIARELHDDINQQVALLSIDLELLRNTPNEKLASEAQQRTEVLARAVHELSHRLHPAKLRLIGLVPALKGLQQELSRDGVQIDFTHDGVPATLPPEITVCLFRVVQEALQNALKYSGARHVSVRLTGSREHLALTVTDRGEGFDVETAWGDAAAALRLAWMKSRSRALSNSVT